MTIPTPPTDYGFHQGEALAHLHTGKPTNTRQHLSAANAHAALAIAAAIDAAIRAVRELYAPVEYAVAGDECGDTGEQNGAGQPPSVWEKTRRIYVASSWRNPIQPQLVSILRSEGHEVYDFRNPDGGTGFSWAETMRPAHTPDPTGPVPAKGTDWIRDLIYLDMLAHPRAQAGFHADFDAMKWADTFVMALPCGKSAHLELGWAAGAGKRTAILLEDPVEPELMYLTADAIFHRVEDLLAWLES